MIFPDTDEDVSHSLKAVGVKCDTSYSIHILMDVANQFQIAKRSFPCSIFLISFRIKARIEASWKCSSFP